MVAGEVFGVRCLMMKFGLKIIGLAVLFAVLGCSDLTTNEPQVTEAESPPTEVSQNEMPMQVVTDFTDVSAESERWRSVDDTVMGGISQGEFYIPQPGTGIFRGTLSLENNGGFSSVRRASDDYDFSGTSSLSVRVKGDGRRYQLRVKPAYAEEDVSYRAAFETTADEWQVVEIPFDQFEPVFRGEIVPDAPPLNAAAIEQVGLFIADGQPGEFRLEVDWIKAE